MPATTFSSPLRPDKTLTIAFTAVALLGIFELAAIGIHFGAKARAARKDTQASVATAENTAAVANPVVAQPTRMVPIAIKTG